MRRSKAPSALRKAKQDEKNVDCSNSEEQYDWGSRSSKFQKLSQNKRIFNVVWRDVSNRKHKTWKGDGTLEVDNPYLKAILKDETGKYIGCSTKVDINELIPDFQMIISGKEVEIQNEIKDEEELHNLRKMQAENWVNEGYKSLEDKSEEEKKPKGGFKFKPILLLKSPKIQPVGIKMEKKNIRLECGATNVQNQLPYLRDNNDDNSPDLVSNDHITQFICFLKPSELQQFLFQKALEYLSSIKSEDIRELDVEHVLKMVCNHPSLINHKTSTNKLLRHLIAFLPDWTEMGPFDSSKLEFIQYFLTDLTRSNQQTCVILAKNLNVLNMLQGLCDFMKIKCLRLHSSTLQNIESQVLKYCSSGNVLTHVILINSLEMLSSFKVSTYCSKILVFEEYFEISNICPGEILKDLTIYYLVTAFSIEELLLLDTYNKDVGNLLIDLIDIINTDNDCCYLHSKIECNCFKRTDKISNEENIFIKNWKHFKPPFDLNLLEVSSLENSSENIISIFCKKNNLT